MTLIFLGLISTLMREDNVRSTLFIPRYFYQQSYLKYTNTSTEYDIVVVADKDKASKTSDGWESALVGAKLKRDKDGSYSVSWDEPVPLKGKINEDGRAMELSDLAYFNGKLYSFDDRTGLVFQVNKDTGKAVPQHILMDGDGHSTKGFKCEWAAVKDDLLYVGGLGKEWTDANGEVKSRDPQWVKTIDTEGRIRHHNWAHVYEALREATGTSSPGYLIHEAVRFHPVLKRWFFFPRRVSFLAYDDVSDETRGSNVVISTNEEFGDIKATTIGPKIPSHGFSSFAFVPFRENELVALKTEEVDGTIATYITVATLDGKILLDETKIGNVKYEGVEFL